jgi:hypothetical protein
MSTKASIKSCVRTDQQPGFHLYDDVLDDFGARDGAPEPPVYLRLDGVSVQLETLNSGGASVTVAIPREMARELGLLPLEDGRRLTRDI